MRPDPPQGLDHS
jgi:hypothetical protein